MREDRVLQSRQESKTLVAWSDSAPRGQDPEYRCPKGITLPKADTVVPSDPIHQTELEVILRMPEA